MFNQGIFQWSIWGYIFFILLTTHISIISVTIYLHRCQAHRSVELNKYLAHFFRFWIWANTSMRTNEWVAVHRKHHAKVETEEDPHSPLWKGLLNIVLFGVYYYRKSKAEPETLEKYSRGTPDDWIEKNLYQKFHYSGTGVILLINLILFGFITGTIMWLIQMIWIPLWAAGVVNGIGHAWGYRNYKTKDASSNISPLGVLIGGEELHNNHHAFPNSAKLSSKWYEFDIGWFYIRIFEKLRLAKVNQSGLISKDF